jgi:hypothetical protein
MHVDYKVVTAAAYRVEKLAELFSTGGFKAMWARLRRAEISLITRDMASVVMSITVVWLAPDARNPIPLPDIVKAMNFPRSVPRSKKAVHHQLRWL